MRKWRWPLIVLVGMGCAAQGHAADFYPTHGQLADKLVGMTVIAACPDQAVLAAIEAETIRLQADYAQIVQPAGQSLCPATIHGPPVQVIEIHELPNGMTLQGVGGVTVGLHYRRQKG